MDKQLAEELTFHHRNHLRRLDQSEEAAKGLRELMKEAREAGATNQEIGDVLGVTRQRVSQILRKDVTK